MIKNYDLKIINGEEILVLYLDYNYELGIDFKLRNKNSNMKNEIIEFIKKNKIKLNSGKIAISIGGIILALLLVAQNPSVDDDISFTYVTDNIILDQIVNVDEFDKDNNSDSIIDGILNDVIIDDKNDSSSNNNSSIQKPSSNNSSNQSSNNNSSIQKPSSNNSSKPSNNNSSSIQKPPSNNGSVANKDEIKEPTTNEQKVTVYRSNGTVITLSLEEYLIGVVGAEMPASFSIEALKAQAIIARTYALKKVESGIKLTDNESTQSYKDNNELLDMWGSSYDTYYNKIKNAVLDTKGLAIYHNGKLIDAVYHSTSNGRTEDSVNVWGNSIPYLKSVDSSWDKDASSYLRVISKDLENVLNLLGVGIDNINFEILSRNESNRVSVVKVGDKTYTGVEFRNLLGLRSSDFDIDFDNNNLIITTRGYGHGVGLSQYGANGMAKKGYNYLQILKHYYTGINIK